jgi:UDP-2,3-diacylglucosamine pyrophosphatase LpxH
MKYRTIWISDLHLGANGSKIKSILSFLKHNDSDYLFLNGDIIDFWKLKTKLKWKNKNNEIVKNILKKSKNNTEIIYVVGNHDDALRSYLPMDFGDIKIRNEYSHTTIGGLRLLITHGDKYDSVMKYAKFLALLGDFGYSVLLKLNGLFNFFSKLFGFKYWSLSKYLKLKVKSAVNFVSKFEQTIAHDCKKQGYNGIVCGHIHHAEIRYVEDVLYLNSGDFVESCTALVEDFDGNIKLLYWADEDDYRVMVDYKEGEIKRYE